MPLDPTIEFILSQTDGRPMYQQLMEHVKTKVTIGDWSQGYRLPSIREMAVAAKVSVITVKRTYQELELEGIIITQHGKGSFISEVDNLSIKLKMTEMDTHLVKATDIGKSIGMSMTKLQKRLIELQNKENSHDKERNND